MAYKVYSRLLWAQGSGEIFCRFGYPKQCKEHSELSKDPGREFVELNTHQNDEIINSYNAPFILGWRANIDFRPVINKEAVIAYVAKYASKGESSSSFLYRKKSLIFKTQMQQE